MSKIPEPKFETIKGSERRVKMVEDWILELEGGLLIIVPKGFETDGASVPRLLWPIFPPFGVLRYGAIIHDFGFQHGYLLSPYNSAQVYNRESLKMMKRNIYFSGSKLIPVYIGKPQIFFDRLFRHVTIEATGDKLAASSAYLALRMFGWIAWDKYRRRGPAAYNRNSLWLPGV